MESLSLTQLVAGPQIPPADTLPHVPQPEGREVARQRAQEKQYSPVLHWEWALHPASATTAVLQISGHLVTPDINMQMGSLMHFLPAGQPR